MEWRKLRDRYRVEDGYWFAPKMYGFGATPVTWQGWALTLGFVVLLLIDLRLEPRPDLKAVLGILLTAVFCAIAWAKTEGGWRWRWGPEDGE